MTEPDIQLVNQEQRTWVLFMYILHLFGAVLAIPSIVALVFNYLLMDRALPETRSHHRWMIRTFWWALAWTILACVLYITLIGIPLAILLWGLIWLWWMYRQIRGLLRLADYRPMPG
ncbi:MAG: hypothetical protein R3270_08120 [Gammaproteobacteria bacterium]|nr:hypothetical protein [Gammaproteobacteria bacterium]